QPRREAQRLPTALQGGQALFQRMPVGIVLARIAEAPRILAIGAAFEGRGKVNGRCYGAGRGVDMAAGMDGASLDFHSSTSVPVAPGAGYKSTPLPGE